MAKKEVSYYNGKTKTWNVPLMQVVDEQEEFKCDYKRNDVPSEAEINYFIKEWNETEKVSEDAINYLFRSCCQNNSDPNQVFAKVSILNDVYSTRLSNKDKTIITEVIKNYADRFANDYDKTLVNDLDVKIKSETKRSAYSFLTKYCSHQNEDAYPIFDSYVELMLKWYRDADVFKDYGFEFGDEDLASRDYDKFKRIMCSFRKAFSLEEVSLKKIDMFLWVAAKNHFFPKYIDEKLIS